jgi:CRISPR-associated endonuclease/helicase Cas3
MNVLLISQCHKNALKQTRRILDQFAERRGERTWQTAITKQGLDTLRRMLKKSARKNTAVACHWIRGRDHTELMWIVGNAAAFNSLGAVPTNTTQKDVLRAESENDWHNAPAIRLLAALAALFHDMGKANDTFQAKLKPGNKLPMADPFRHEWVSLRILQALAGGAKDDREWLTGLLDPPGSRHLQWQNNLITDPVQSLRDPLPWKTIPPLAQAVGWLMVSHHRMPGLKPDDASPRQLAKQPITISPDWCGSNYKTEGLKAAELKKSKRP